MCWDEFELHCGRRQLCDVIEAMREHVGDYMMNADEKEDKNLSPCSIRRARVYLYFIVQRCSQHLSSKNNNYKLHN